MWSCSAAQYLPCLSRLGSRSVLVPPAAAGVASWRPACSPPSPSPWQILWRGRHWKPPSWCIIQTETSTLYRQEESHSPRQDTQHQVQHKERANNDERNEVNPVPCGTQGIVGLKFTTFIHSLLHKYNNCLLASRFRTELLSSRCRERPSIPPWWYTGRLWAQQTGCCRTVWCRHWARSRCHCSRTSLDTSSLRRRTPTPTSQQSHCLQKKRIATVKVFCWRIYVGQCLCNEKAATSKVSRETREYYRFHCSRSLKWRDYACLPYV